MYCISCPNHLKILLNQFILNQGTRLTGVPELCTEPKHSPTAQHCGTTLSHPAPLCVGTRFCCTILIHSSPQTWVQSQDDLIVQILFPSQTWFQITLKSSSSPLHSGWESSAGYFLILEFCLTAGSSCSPQEPCWCHTFLQPHSSTSDETICKKYDDSNTALEDRRCPPNTNHCVELWPIRLHSDALHIFTFFLMSVCLPALYPGSVAFPQPGRNVR